MGGDSWATRLASSEHRGKDGGILTNSPAWKLPVIQKSAGGSYELILHKDVRGSRGERGRGVPTVNKELLSLRMLPFL